MGTLGGRLVRLGPGPALNFRAYLQKLQPLSPAKCLESGNNRNPRYTSGACHTKRRTLRIKATLVSIGFPNLIFPNLIKILIVKFGIFGKNIENLEYLETILKIWNIWK